MVAATVSPTRPAFGTFTTGGTESILVALKAYRDHPDFTGDELVLPATAHPAFGKAAHYLGLRTTAVPVNDDGTVDPPAVLGAISDSTLVIGLSAPNFPFGTVDPITDIAPVAQARGVGVHVDAAVGGLFLPFVDDAPPFALDVDGVTSVSVDVHKYGYGAKGASVLLFATQQLRRASYYVDADWAGGAYAASAVVGTRPVGPAAAAYAAMVHLGRDGYRRLVGEVLDTAARLQRGLADATTLHVIGRPPTGVFAMTGEAPIVRRLALGLRRRGWLADALASPPALHFVATPRHAAAVDAFIRDAAAALDDPDDGDAPLASYGVMVRGAVDEKSLHAALDRRYDGTGAS
jgi:glutamate/tyrosine decarboxylase-like PLP-dependent enzyme